MLSLQFEELKQFFFSSINQTIERKSWFQWNWAYLGFCMTGC